VSGGKPQGLSRRAHAGSVSTQDHDPSHHPNLARAVIERMESPAFRWLPLGL
jgi:hypothetical protein